MLRDVSLWGWPALKGRMVTVMFFDIYLPECQSETLKVQPPHSEEKPAWLFRMFQKESQTGGWGVGGGGSW